MTETRQHPTVAALPERDAATYLGFQPTTLRKWRWQGLGPSYVRSQRAVRYLVADLDHWLAQNRVERVA